MSVKSVGNTVDTLTNQNQGKTVPLPNISIGLSSLNKKNELRNPSSVNIQIKSNTFGGVSFPSGSSLKVDYVNGKKEGAGLVLSAKKTKLAKLNFHEDKVEGFCVFFNSNGMREKECMYENDVQTGWGCEYKNDKLVFEGLYKNGERYSELKNYSVDSRFMEEVKNGDTLSVCQYNSNHKREGLCYLYENGKMKYEVKFENGVEKMKMKEFVDEEMIEFDEEMIEFDEEGRLIYKGEYNGSISNGFNRAGRGECMKYVKGVLNEVIRLMNGVESVRCVLKGKEMKEYEGDKLVYEGEFCMKNGSVVRNGIGMIHLSSSSFYTAVYENGVEKRRMKEMNGDEMIEYDEERRVVYKGGYDKKNKRKGKGVLYEYDGDGVKEVYDCENGERKGKMMEFRGSHMFEFNDKNEVVYQGEFCGSCLEGFKRSGKGLTFEYVDKEIREYDRGNLIYEGSYSWSTGIYQRHGVGIVYDSSSVVYTALFENGVEKMCYQKMEGDVMIEYDEEGRVVYKGGYDKKEKCFVKSGNGGLYEYNGDRLEVYDCENGERTVKRLEFEFSSMIELNENGGVVYKGDYEGTPCDGYMRNGEGDEFDKDDMLVYSGSWKNGKREGNGSYYQNGDLRYNGEWKNDKPNGDGKLYNSDGVVIREGKWKNGYNEVDKGVWMYYEDGKLCGLYENGERKYEGEWKNGVSHGKGRYLSKEGKVVYEGEWKNGKPHGKGRYLNKEGEVLYEGEWKNGMIEIEKGVWFDYESGMKCLMNGENVIYRGEIMNGVPNGNGYVIDGNKVIVGGDWENGVLTLSDNQNIEMENGIFIMNSLESSGLFRCGHSWKHYSMSEMTFYDKNIRKYREWRSIENTVRSIIVGENCCNDVNGYLMIGGYAFLQSLVVKKNSLKNLNSLKISDNPVLKNIEIESATYSSFNGGKIIESNGAFVYVKSITITSTLIAD